MVAEHALHVPREEPAMGSLTALTARSGYSQSGSFCRVEWIRSLNVQPARSRYHTRYGGTAVISHRNGSAISTWSSSKGAAHCGERWNTVADSTRSAIAGTSCIELAPLPITPTRLPVRSRSSGQRAVWTSVPANRSRPSILGHLGRCSPPTAVTRTLAVSSSVAGGVER